MTIYFNGAEMCAWNPSDAGTTEITSGGFDASFARNAIRAGVSSGGTQYAFTPDLGLPDEFYVHLDVTRATADTSSRTLLELHDGTTGLFRLQSTDASIQMQRWNGSAWTNVGASVSTDLYSARQTIDLYIDGNTASGTATLFLSGTERVSAAADLTLVTGIEHLRCYGLNFGAGHILSQTVVADEPTIGWRLVTVSPTGSGATADWDNSYASIDEAVLNDVDFIYSDTNGQIELVTGAAVGSLTGYTIRAVGVYARAKRGAGGPQNLQIALRVNGANYFSSSKPLGVGYEAYGHIWEENPDTTDPWLTTEIAALQFGVKAVT